MEHTTGEDKPRTLRVQCEYCDAITTGEVVYGYHYDGEVIPVLVRVHHRCI